MVLKWKSRKRPRGGWRSHQLPYEAAAGCSQNFRADFHADSKGK